MLLILKYFHVINSQIFSVPRPAGQPFPPAQQGAPGQVPVPARPPAGGGEEQPGDGAGETEDAQREEGQ